MLQGRRLVVVLLLVLLLLLLVLLVLWLLPVLQLLLQGLVRRGHPLLQLVLRVQLEVLLLRWLLVLGWPLVLLQGAVVLHRRLLLLLLLLLGAQFVAARHRHVGSGEHLRGEQVQEAHRGCRQPLQACNSDRPARPAARMRHRCCL